MRPMRLGPPAAALAATVLALLAPAASAHTTVVSDDGQYRIVVGQLEEPVVTYQKTGLDLCFQANTTGREPVTGVNPGALTATLVAPDGARRTQDLRAQFGRAGCFQFQDAYVLTVPGQYTVDLQGDILGSAVDVRGVAAGGPVKDAGTIMFPSDEPTNAELADGKADAQAVAAKADAAALEALQQRVATLEAQMESQGEGGRDAGPSAAAPLLALGLVAAAVVVRRRAT